MIVTDELSNPSRYKIIIQIKKNRFLKRKAKYLNADFDFIEDINQALEFPDMKSAEDTLVKVSRISSNDARPRIIIKYLIPEIKNQPKNEHGV